jgi:hypothetical protein
MLHVFKPITISPLFFPPEARTIPPLKNIQLHTMSSTVPKQAPASLNTSEERMILADQKSGHHITSEKEPSNAPGASSAPDRGVHAWLVAARAASVFLCILSLANSFGTFEEYYLTH